MRNVLFSYIFQVWPSLEPANSYEKDGFKETRLSMFSHTGTHMDPPAHLFEGRTSLDAFDPEQFNWGTEKYFGDYSCIDWED